jgi:N-acetylmuramoyl-L-alanine amidase
MVDVITGDTNTLKSETVARKTIKEPLFGPKYEELEIRSDELKGRIFYVISGHGGPDPGAMGLRLKNRLAEDEYAYDVSLRLARNLMEQGATVHIIIQDPVDGIRDGEYLVNKKHEVCYGGQPIPLKQIPRLKQRTDAVNALHRKYLKRGIKDHTVIAIHIDSRPIRQRTDVFFYHYDKSRSGKKLAMNLQDTFREKYKVNRSNGAYHGTVSARNLYVLKHTNPPAVYVELANIQNPSDQIRITQVGNRQALANWLYEGIIK